ncbi:MAG: D-glycero-beta-D-manno-heptose 1-phosphate adenylyltransferase [Elusimicrobia bacterium]|jgi:rfaE bifunctional protein nucleotidyltransferase chain/domain|nr:D-glycero-beta-D-manno-heptose 1-phosphate adenylyltransferase [Elusimicrobiota bacterium]
MKLITLNTAKKKVEALRKSGKKIVFTNGCFDIIHSGHIKVLRKCRELGDVVIVGLNSDSSIRQLKGEKRPVNSLRDRVEVLSAISYVDYIIVFNELTPYNVVKVIKPDFLVKGGDYKAADVVGREFAKKVVIISLLKDRSTTNIIEKILNK